MNEVVVKRGQGSLCGKEPVVVCSAQGISRYPVEGNCICTLSAFVLFLNWIVVVGG